MGLPPVLRQRTLWLVLGPLVALVAVVGVTRLGGGSPAEERAARATTTTTTAPSTTTTAPGDAVTPPSTPDSGSGAAVAEVLGVQEDSGFSEGESLAGVGFEDAAATEVLGESFTQLDLVVPPPDPVTPPTTTPPPAPTTTAPTTTAPTTTTTPTTTAPTTTTTAPPSVQVQSRTVTLQLACSVTGQAGSVPVTAVLGVSTLTAVPANTSLPVLVGLLGPPNLLGEVKRGELAQQVRLTAVGTGAPPLQLQTSNPLPLAAGAVVPIPDGGDDFLAGSFPVSSPAGGSISIEFQAVSFTRSVGGQEVVESCIGALGAPVQIATLGIVAPGTPTTTVPLPPPVVSESPITALLPISAVVVVGAALGLLVRRRRSGPAAGPAPGGAA